MTLSTAEITAVVGDLAPRLQGTKIERIDQPEREKLVLTVRGHGSLYWLLLCVHPRMSRLHLLTTRPPQGEPAAGFCKVVRQHLTGAPLLELRQRPNDRIIIVESQERDKLLRAHRVRLVAELVGVTSNLVLVDESDRVLACLNREDSARRKLCPGERYRMPEPPDDLPPRAFRNRFADRADPSDPPALSGAIQAHYARLEAEERVEQLRTETTGALRTHMKRSRRRLRNLREELERAENADSWRRKGELLKLALPSLRKGQKEVALEDLFEPDRPQVTISLDPTLSPTENMQLMFRRYRKARSGREEMEQRAEATSRELDRLEALLDRAQSAESAEQLEELRGQLQSAGLLRPQGRQTQRRERRTGPREFECRDGHRILVARNARENERLTFTIAHGNDYWLHVRGWPGPHVVVRQGPDGDVSSAALRDAAHLAVHFSKVRGTDYAEVVYTRCKNVRRLKGASSGQVSYADASTMAVRPDRARLQRLLRNRPPR